jgi:FkbM family methyltransferase
MVKRRLLPSNEWQYAGREEFFAAAAKQTPIVAVESEGLTFLVSTADRGFGRHFFTHEQTRSDMVVLARALEHLDASGLGARARDRVFLDVGANLGTACLLAVARHGFRRAIALEPETQNFRLLRANVALNLLEDRIDALRLAASSHTGFVELTVSRSSGKHRVRAPEAEAKSMQVDAVTLDVLLARVGLEPDDIGLLWIDVEGHEPSVLRGASALLASGVPVVTEVRRRMSSLRSLLPAYASVADLRAGEPVAPIAMLEEIMARLDDKRYYGTITDILLLP